jgi:ABC-2 type transport system ATP-binding protein
VLKIDYLWKSYQQHTVLQNLCLQVPPGEIYGLLGPNGAGKTTTINLLCNLLKPDRGSITIDGQSVSEATKSLIGIAPQENLIYKTLTCAENLSFFAQIYGLSRKKQQERVEFCLAAVGLSDRANRPAETLSGGMQRRLSLAIALIHQPQLLVLDEPTTGLDIEARYDIWELLTQLQSQGMTILLTTHLLDEAERLCQRIGILKQGSIIAEGSLAELRQLIPAKEILIIQTPCEPEAIARANALGFPHRRYGGDLAFWLPDSLELKDIVIQFDGIPLDSLSRHPVRLEHIYVEVTQNS